ncbi:hypothetical protein [Chryseobacterium piperi]|uniref:hypothetical protein n=1 Tax=Chryseobacterium piperi TaxID=558152 RepID=UPI0012FDEE8F|nr:hypothetical protein [Chryseobacterium piperi]
MKQKKQTEKKLSLNKLQMTKVTNLRSIVGGAGHEEQLEGGNDNTITFPTDKLNK